MALGINPAWRSSAGFYVDDILPSLEAHRAGDFERYRLRRAMYFRGGPEFHGGHYTRLGTALRGAFTGEGIFARDKQAAAKALFDRHILMADLLPWWSTNIKDINFAGLHNVPFYPAWQEILRGWVQMYRPRAIIANTSGEAQRSAIRLLLGVELTAFSEEPTAYAGMYNGAPLFVHPQLNGCRELSHKRYQQLAQEWQRAVGVTIRLRIKRAS